MRGKRRGGRKNAARLARAEFARAERARAERASPELARAEPDVLADVPDYTVLYAVAAAPFEAQARELVTYLKTMRETNGAKWLTDEEICDELIETAGNCECAGETAILDGVVPALNELIEASLVHPPAFLTAISVARRALSRLTAEGKGQSAQCPAPASPPKRRARGACFPSAARKKGGHFEKGQCEF